MYDSSGGRRLLASALLIVCILVLVNKTAHVRVETTIVERAASDIMGPLQDLANRLLGPLSSAVRDLANLSSIRNENEQLRQKIGSMPLLEAELKEAQMENERLRAMLKFAATVPTAYVPAAVIGRNSDNWLSTCVINKGSSSGIMRDDPVVTSSGLVGRVIKVSLRTSTVMLVVDPDSGAGGLVQRSRDSGVIVGQVGTGQMLKMRFFSRDSDVQVGDIILTSGLGSVFPKGLPVGTVMAVGRGDYGLAKTADVVPFVNFDRLEEVLVLRGVTSPVEEGGH